MKLLVLLFVIGCAFAAPRQHYNDALEKTIDEIINDIFGDAPVEGLYRSESVLEKNVREAFDKLLEKVKDAIEKGKTVETGVIEKLKSSWEQMNKLKIDMNEKAKDIYNIFKAKVRDFLRNLLDKLDDNKEKSHSPVQQIEGITKLFKKLKDYVLSKIDKEALIEKIEKLFGKGNEMADKMAEMIKEHGEKGKQKLLDLIDRILGEDEEKKEHERRSLSEFWDKVQNFFKDLRLKISENCAQFGEWVKDTVKTGLEKSKTEQEKVKVIAENFIDRAKEMKKDVVAQALNFFNEYKDKLGEEWDKIKKVAREQLKKSD